MKFQDAKAHRNIPFSIFLMENSAALYLCIFAALTLLTHLAQVLALTFRVYAYFSLTVSALVLFFLVPYLFGSFRSVIEKDYSNALGIFALCIFGAVVSVIYHRVGRISPDEFYYSANPVYFLANPDAKIGFQIHTFYSKDPIFSIAYLTAGAYEYIQAAFSFFLNVRFATFYYLIGAGFTGFMICASYFLLIRWFLPDSGLALLGTFGIVCSIFIMGEGYWTPGAYSFMRAFEGKSFFLFAGLPLFTYFSLLFFEEATIGRFIILFILTTSLGGMTTSSIPIIPILGGILFLSYSLAYLQPVLSVKKLLMHGIAYFLSFSYLVVYGVCVALFDDANAALYFNKDYVYPFMGYLMGFVHVPFPSTLILFVIFSILACFFTMKRKSIFLILWLFLTISLVLNPMAAKIYLLYFTGIYFRFFYILPFPLAIGLVIAFGGSAWKQHFPKAGGIFAPFVILLLLFLVLVLPTSIFRMENYTWGYVLNDREFMKANSIIEIAPKGVMLAPYPLSGAVQMLDGNFPQLVHRDDIIDYYLTIRNQADGQLRLRAGAFAKGENEDFYALFEIARKYPELRTIVLYKKVFYRFQKQLKDPLINMGFKFDETNGLMIISR